MLPEPLDDPRQRAAARILDLARRFAARSRDSQQRLLEEFQAAVAEHARVLGPVTIEDDDDEQLVLGADGRFQGRLSIEAGSSTTWQVVGGAADVVDHYDLVDLFSDLSDAIAEQVPSVDGAATLPGAGSGGWSEAAAPVDEAAESASQRVLRDLHEAGVYSDAEYAAKLAELGRSPDA